ncbi:MAG: hypothetical protein MJZ18_01155 [Bacteroidales bacterium]|nr:hypothetical protein [Bacteroidales bacterium]
MKRFFFMILIMLTSINVYSQIEKWSIDYLDNEYTPYFMCYNWGDGHEAHGVYGETIEDKIYMSFDMKQTSECVDACSAVFAKWNWSSSFYLVILDYGNYMHGVQYLLTIDSNGKVIDNLMVFVSNNDYHISPMQSKIQVDKSIIVRQAVITSLIDNTLMCGGYIPKEFYMQYVDKTYTISSEGKFILKNTTEHAIEKKTWKDFEGLNIIMDE